MMSFDSLTQCEFGDIYYENKSITSCEPRAQPGQGEILSCDTAHEPLHVMAKLLGVFGGWNRKFPDGPGHA